MTDVPKIAQLSPYPTEVEAGETYYWCACGLSQNQPYCDGSHQGTGLAPVAYTAEESGTAYFCGCKASAASPLCDGSHATLAQPETSTSEPEAEVAADPVISLREDGPLVVKAPPKLTGADGAEVETKPVAALCRCGASKNKPFCDGSHVQAGFSSAPDRSKLRNAALQYSGKVDGVDVTISYTPVLCTHAGECSKRAAAVFNPGSKPWVTPEAGKLDEILDVMAACPSGALRVAIGDGPQTHMTTPEIGIAIEKDGPYHVTNVALEAEFNGVGASRGKYSLCRCGLSKNKPFCDGTHYDAKWTDD